ncbi:hypothetical protein [Longispora urticae]
MNFRTRAFAVLASTTVALGLVSVVAPTAAQASYWCSSGSFCWYSRVSGGGERATIEQYTSDWIRMPSLVDLSESSDNEQTYPAGQCKASVYLSDTYYNRRWTFYAGDYQGQVTSTFNSVLVYDTGTGTYYHRGSNNTFNDISNSCSFRP